MAKNSTFFTTKMNRSQQILLGAFFVLLSVLLTVAFVSFFTTWQSDQSLLLDFFNRNAEVQNAAKKLGAIIAYFFIYQLFGISSLLWVALLFLSGLYFFVGKKSKSMTNRWFWGSFLVVWISLFLGFFFQFLASAVGA